MLQWKERFSIAVVVVLLAAPGRAEELDVMSVKRWSVLREVERYQLQIAHEQYKKGNWKAALSEAEKYLTLYEESEAAPYAQLLWSISHVQLKKSNTAIKEGFQSILDYWPDSPEAVAAAYYIGQTYRGMGDVRLAKRAYRDVITNRKEGLAAVRAASDLKEIARQEKNRDSEVDLLKQLAFDFKRTDKLSDSICRNAAGELAAHYFLQAAFDEGVNATEASLNKDKAVDLTAAVANNAIRAIQQLASNSETNAKAGALASRVVAYLREQVPADQSTDEEKTRARNYWYHIASTQAAAELTAEVPKTYEQAVRIFGGDDETFARLAAWYKTQKRFDDARKTYARYSDKAEGVNQVAISYRDEKKYDAAVKAFEQIVSLQPDREVHWKTQIAETYRNYAKKHADAIRTYTDILAIDSDRSAHWQEEIARTYREAGKYAEAIQVYRELLSTDTMTTKDWRYEIANTYRQANQLKDAAETYLASRTEPGKYLAAARCYRELKEYRPALLNFAHARDNFSAVAAVAQFEIGVTHREAKNKESAIKAFQQVCKKYPTTPKASEAHAILQREYKISITLGGAKDD